MVACDIQKCDDTTVASKQQTVPLYRPAVDVIEYDNEIVMNVDMPGVTSDGIEIDFERGLLTVSAQVAPRRPEGEFLLREYGVGNFHRCFEVGETVDASRISASLEHGVLTVTLPKQEAVRPRRIAVQ